MNEAYRAARDAKLQDIRDHPERHKHGFEGLTACCMINGVLDSWVMEAHERHASTGRNGSRSCDVTSGPCSCGAWH